MGCNLEHGTPVQGRPDLTENVYQNFRRLLEKMRTVFQGSFNSRDRAGDLELRQLQQQHLRTS